MSPNYVALTVVLSLVLLVSAAGKLTRHEKIVANMHGVGVPDAWFPRLAAVEIAGAAGLLVGLAWHPLGVAAAVGVFLYFCGAVFFHLRARDRKGLIPPAALALVALAAGLLAAQAG